MKEWISPIPKTIDLIWIGNNPLPDYTKLFIKSFFDNCPEFTIKLWTEKNLNSKNFPKTYKYIQKRLKISRETYGKKLFEYRNYPLLWKRW